jgi:dTMP kinase
MNSSKGKFIILEGSEGAGKSSQIKKLAEYFGDKVIITREPGGSPYAEEIRNVILKSEYASQADAKTHFALFWAARADHLKNTIIPALESGKTVLCDRFDSSTYAYQIYGQQATELKEQFFTFRDFFLGDMKPDLYIFMQVDIKTGLMRKGAQPEEINHFEQRSIDFFDRMNLGFQEFFSKVPNEIVDANPGFEIVTDELIKIIEIEMGK